MDAISPPLDLIEIDVKARKPMGDYKRVSWGELTKALDRTWYMDLSVGRVFFRRLGQLRRDDVNIRWAKEHPEFAEMVQEADILREFLDRGIPLDDDHMKKLENLNISMMPVEKMQYLECVFDRDDDGGYVRALHSLADLDAFLSALEPREVDAVYGVLREMVTSRPITEESKVLLLLAQEYGIPIAKDLTLENMTAEMADALTDALVERGEAVKDTMGRLEHGK